jgi:hypothetical protein
MTAVLYCIVGGGVGENGKDGEDGTGHECGEGDEGSVVVSVGEDVKMVRVVGVPDTASYIRG